MQAIRYYMTTKPLRSDRVNIQSNNTTHTVTLRVASVSILGAVASIHTNSYV